MGGVAVGLRPKVREALLEGAVIPAHPLVLTGDRKLDERRQRALTRYYVEAGAGGIAVGVHTTQFHIREHGLLETVLRMAAEEAERAGADEGFIKVAGICGPSDQARKEAVLAASLGYDLGLLSPGGLNDWTEEAFLDRVGQVAEVIPVFGFYLQPAVGGRLFSMDFWRSMADIPGVMAMKIAPFDRYRTLEVVRGVCASRRREEIALYTGNDDHIVADLLTPFQVAVEGDVVEKWIVGGLLGHWAVWTKKAVEMMKEIRAFRQSGGSVPMEWWTRGARVTEANAALFDAVNGFRGCIPGIHEILQRQGLLAGRWCLDPAEDLSPGQAEEIDRILQAYPELTDDNFVRSNRDRWLEEAEASMKMRP
ncbi:dihydrodipicolinate synthase family protein [Salinithrix halophila]|uniref:Dihydrodipicolinate synthase family protein n=1 Tax=Salinithrix halophila TaxID=1485204 RepID=A0ABV8JBR6_9BACL